VAADDDGSLQPVRVVELDRRVKVVTFIATRLLTLIRILNFGRFMILVRLSDIVLGLLLTYVLPDEAEN
jgi:hypothetical protein